MTSGLVFRSGKNILTNVVVELKWMKRGVRAKFEGESGLNDIKEVDDLILSDPRGEEMRFQIMDYSGVESVHLSKEDMRIVGCLDRAMVNTLRLPSGPVRLAVVSDPQGQVRPAFETYLEVIGTDRWKCRFFTTREAAHQWLRDEGFEITD